MHSIEHRVTTLAGPWLLRVSETMRTRWLTATPPWGDTGEYECMYATTGISNERLGCESHVNVSESQV